MHRPQRPGQGLFGSGLKFGFVRAHEPEHRDNNSNADQ
jgi:hypothetical protein